MIRNRALDRTKLALIFANVQEEDILLRDELDELAKDSNGQFSVYYVLNRVLCLIFL